MRLNPELPQVACFDTAFHRTAPEVDQAFALLYALHDEGIRRYGFHGLSYEYITSILPQRAPEIADGRIVVAHFGNGCFAVALSHRQGAMPLIVLGLGATVAGSLLGPGWTPVVASLVRRGGNMLVFSALTWVVAHAVYAPGRITSRRLQGAVVVYLNLATIFASAFTPDMGIAPAAFANLTLPAGGGPAALDTMMYFSLATLPTTGYGDIVPVDAFARSLANFEAVLGQLYLAITVARLVTLELEDRRR